MKSVLAAAALALAASSLFVPAAQAAGKINLNTAPAPGFTGQWYTTPAGCSYPRAQAPGYPPTWHLIINPHHIGQPTAKASCPAMLNG